MIQRDYDSRIRIVKLVMLRCVESLKTEYLLGE